MAEKKIQGSITLVTVEDGAPGSPGAPGTSTYTYVRYAEDINGTNMSVTPTDKTKYIGIITTTSSTAPNTGYTWSKYVGDDGQDGQNGKDGENGANGKSAYQLWLEAGNIGTEADYLESLKGKDGADGADGKSAYQLWLDAGNSGTEEDYLNSLKGADGKDGKDGIAEKYRIETNVEDVNKFLDSGSNDAIFSPEELQFTVLKDNEVIEPKTDYFYSLSLITNNNIVVNDTIRKFIDKIYTSQGGNSEDESEQKETFIKEQVEIALENFKDLYEFFYNIDNSEWKIPIEDKETEEYIYLLDKILKEYNNRINFNLAELIKLTLSDEINNPYYLSFELLKQIIKQEISVFYFKVYSDANLNDFLVYKTINCEFGLPEELAKFNQTASFIQMAVDDSKMTFSADGLTITDGNFKIEKIIKDSANSENDKVEEVLYFSPDTGELYITGNGSFTGKIKGQSGEIGGFIITNSRLYSPSGTQINEVDKFNFEEGTEYYELIDDNYVLTSDEYLFVNKTYYLKDDEIYTEVTEGFFISDYVYYLQDEQENYIDVTEQQADLTKKYYYAQPSLMLFGKEGKIIVNDIELGSGAKIKDFIDLGNGKAYIYNPDLHNGLFLQAGNNITLDATNEIFKIGNLTFSGKSSQISGSSFSIQPDYSYFNNITVSGEIATAIFTKSSTQAVGGAMLFKVAYKIESQSFNNISTFSDTPMDKKILTVVLEPEAINSFSFEQEDTIYYVVLIDKTGKQSESLVITKDQVNIDNDEYVNINFEVDDVKEYNSLVILGQAEDIIIGVNSDKTESKWLYPEGLTISKLNLEEENENPELKVFLGNLNGIKDIISDNINDTTDYGYGLYSNNVFLKGSLTTQTGDNSYAGVNTLNGAAATIFGTGANDDQSKIVFWAGAESNSNDAIQNANFQVTEAGSIYAARGFFEDSVIARSIISGADIYAARLHGVALDGEGNPIGEVGALTIYDTNAGIVFKTGFNTEEEKETFSIGVDGLKVNENYFIRVNEVNEVKEISFNGYSGNFNVLDTKDLTLNIVEDNQVCINNEIGFNVENRKINDGTFTTINYLRLTSDSFKIVFGNEEKLKLNTSSLDVNVTNANFSQNMRLGNDNLNIEYRQTTDGYDVYVYKQS